MQILGIDEVNQRLPLIKPIARDIQREWEIISEQKIESEKLSEGEEKNAILGEIKKSIDKINGYIKEVEQIGGSIASFKNGEIHFESLYHGRKIFLCVLPLKENKVQYFHELDEILSDRIPVDEHVLKNITKRENNA